MSRGNLAIVGIGEVPTGIYPHRSPWDIIYETCMAAVRDSGLDKNDIEAVVTVAPQAQPRLTAEISFGKLPEELGLKGCKDVCICNAGGASTSNCLRLAEQLINSATAKTVLIPHVTVHSTIPVNELINFFAQAGMDLQWEYPFGTTYNGIIAMMVRRYMYESGATPEEMASVVVSMRKWAALDPNSMFYQKEVPSIEKVLSSSFVADPLHKRECNVLADGGCRSGGHVRRAGTTGHRHAGLQAGRRRGLFHRVYRIEGQRSDAGRLAQVRGTCSGRGRLDQR